MSDSFSYYSNWRSEIVTCPKCGWKGCVQDGKIRYFGELLDCCCPRCVLDHVILAMVGYPTGRETKEVAEAGNSEAIRELARIEFSQSRTARFHREKLEDANELPDIDGDDALDFVLDTDEGSGRRDGERWNLIMLGDRVIWRELAFWEGHRRYPELVELLRRKYGSRFKRLKASCLARTYLQGEKWRLPFEIESV
jgi:hypothetical protein